MWIINHFKVLPTEARFKELTELQKNLIFVGYLEHPTSEQIHKACYGAEATKVTRVDEKSFEKLGYSQEQIAHIKEQAEIIDHA